MSNITIYKGIEITEVNTYHYVFTLNGMKYINKNLKFQILTNGSRHDMFIHETYSAAKSRLQTLERIFKYSTHEILVIE